jgi:hypothetical protein
MLTCRLGADGSAAAAAACWGLRFLCCACFGANLAKPDTASGMPSASRRALLRAMLQYIDKQGKQEGAVSEMQRLQVRM